MQNKKIFCLLKKHVIKQDKRANKDLENNIASILNLYTDRVNDFVNNLDDNRIEGDIWFGLNNEVHFC